MDWQIKITKTCLIFEFLKLKYAIHDFVWIINNNNQDVSFCFDDNFCLYDDLTFILPSSV